MESYYRTKVVLITGSSQGIGLELAKALVRYGTTVYGLSRTKSAFTHHLFRQYIVDLSKPTLPAEILETFFDVIFLNVGSSTGRKKLDDIPLEKVEEMVQVNVLSHLRLLKLLRYEKVSFTNSVVGFVGIGEFSLYCASKSFIASLNEALVMEGKSTYIIHPYKVNTALFPEMSDFCVLDKAYVARTMLDDIYSGRRKRILPRWFLLAVISKAFLPDCLFRLILKALKKALLREKGE